MVKGYVKQIPFQHEYYLKKVIPMHHDRSVEDTVYEEILSKLKYFPEHLRLMFLHLWGVGLRISEICTLEGKAYLHDIGKNLVAMMIESAGFEVIDLGVDVPTEKFVETIKANPDVKIVGCSALLTTTMPALKATVEALNTQDFRGNIKVMVGGAPITQEFADEIGADAYTADAASAAQKAKELVA